MQVPAALGTVQTQNEDVRVCKLALLSPSPANTASLAARGLPDF